MDGESHEIRLEIRATLIDRARMQKAVTASIWTLTRNVAFKGEFSWRAMVFRLWFDCRLRILSTDWLIDYLIDWSVDHSFDLSIDWLISIMTLISISIGRQKDSSWKGVGYGVILHCKKKW